MQHNPGTHLPYQRLPLNVARLEQNVVWRQAAPVPHKHRERPVAAAFLAGAATRLLA